MLFFEELQDIWAISYLLTVVTVFFKMFYSSIKRLKRKGALILIFLIHWLIVNIIVWVINY